MSRRLTAFLLFLAAIAVVFLVGPRPDSTVSLVRPDLPVDLDTWLNAREAAVSDLRPGDARRIQWVNPATHARTPLAIVYLHGFSASPQETSPLSEDLGRTLNANVYWARMPGHGRSSPGAMGEASLSDWINEGVEALAVGRRLGRRVLLIGTSTGGTLAFWLAASGATPPPDAVALISPNFAPQDKRSELLLWPWGARLAPSLIGEWHVWQAANAEQGRHWSTRYPLRAVVPMMQLVEQTRQLDLNRYTVPTLILSSPHDKVVRPEVTDSLYARMGAKGGAPRRVEVTTADDPKQHVLAGRILSPRNTPAMEKEILDFVRATVALD